MRSFHRMSPKEYSEVPANMLPSSNPTEAAHQLLVGILRVVRCGNALSSAYRGSPWLRLVTDKRAHCDRDTPCPASAAAVLLAGLLQSAGPSQDRSCRGQSSVFHKLDKGIGRSVDIIVSVFPRLVSSHPSPLPLFFFSSVPTTQAICRQHRRPLYRLPRHLAPAPGRRPIIPRIKSRDRSHSRNEGPFLQHLLKYFRNDDNQADHIPYSRPSERRPPTVASPRSATIRLSRRV
ncbi:hypothetical protein B0T11DRAFT_69516 [Plectosphaerella cucumerina]|uniref:Uncharacterized protein n=1 Tax=Plectosphaerella cucumerina TaxID=40658 RepID=A0A8K0TK78_9PEZI|nr:hypothetical protein B0T11DRAFT_69516 [Plectosphaerella cucumerina]